MNRVFYVLYIPDRQLQNYLDLLRLVADPSVTSSAHLTVRGPYVTKQLSQRRWMMPSKVNVQVSGAGAFFSDTQSTVFLKCTSDDLRRFWWKRDYKNFEPHITIYDGKSRALAQELLQLLGRHSISFAFKVQRLYEHDPTHGQFSLGLDWGRYRLILADIGEEKITQQIIRKLSEDDRLAILEKLVNRLENYLRTSDLAYDLNDNDQTPLELEEDTPSFARDRIFISHAAPEDNQFSRWLTLRLISEGYATWCDLVRLKGGEDFWRDIEDTIRQRCSKFIFVLSNNSNMKEGPLQELAVAKAVARENNLHDFIIPLHLDDLSYSKMSIEIKRLNAIPFDLSWADGLKQLMAKLEEDRVPKDLSYTPDVAASWWRKQFSASLGVIRQRENYLSNWFQLHDLPREIYFHLLQTERVEPRNVDIAEQPAYPVSRFASGVFSFAKREDFENRLVRGLLIPDSHKFLTQDLLEGKHARTFVKSRHAHNAVMNLLEQAWRRLVISRGLGIHSLANRSWCFYFVKDQVRNDRLDFMNVNGEKSRRSIMGYRTLRARDEEIRLRHWHFGLSARLMLAPVRAFAMKGHVLFSDDGKQVWASAERLHRARMSQCRNWWNDDWRDRMLATMNWLASGENVIRFPVGSEECITVSSYPIQFDSEVTYREPAPSPVAAEFVEYEDVDDEEAMIVAS